MINRKISFATPNDIPGILNVLEQNIYTNKSQEKNQMESEGFLKRSFTADDLVKALMEKDILLVSKEDEIVIGYAWNKPLPKADWVSNIETTPQIHEILTTKKVLHHKHIAKSLDKKGVGKLLLQAIIDEARLRNYEYIVCEIVQKPFQNKVSMLFHEQMGFEKVGMLYEDILMLAIYLKKL